MKAICHVCHYPHLRPGKFNPPLIPLHSFDACTNVKVSESQIGFKQNNAHILGSAKKR